MNKGYLVMSECLCDCNKEMVCIYIQKKFMNKDDAISALKEKLTTDYPKNYPCEPVLIDDSITVRFEKDGKSYEHDVWIGELPLV